MNFETFSFMFRGQMVTVDLTPFGENWDSNLGLDARVERAATVLNWLVTLNAEVGRDHNRIRSECLQKFFASGTKDTKDNRTDFLRMQPSYIESKRTRDWLDNAVRAMLYGHYPRLRHAAEAVRQGTQATGAVSRSPGVHGA